MVSVLLATALIAPAAEPSAAALEFFEKKVRPVLASACFDCHGGGKKLRGGLTLTHRDGLLKGGDTGPAFVPGHPEDSLLVKAIGYKDELKMPPRGKLTAEQIADLTTWVKMGAPWPGASGAVAKTAGAFDLQARKKSHWAWQPLAGPKLPEVKDLAWQKNPIDRLVRARLDAAGLPPAAPADKRTLLRRATFDLTGLPPTRAEIRAFLADESPEAFEKVVDRLLASSAYGERWARHWLDLVRFAETRGHEFDFEIPRAYEYRDYAIRAFNADLPYDQFVREHLAGDLLATPRRHPTERFNESILATGFWFFGEGKHSPVDIRLDGDERRDNMIDVFSKTFLGLTVSCARCHDHKFDAISTKDYYALAGYLQSSRQHLAFIDPPDRMGKPLAALQALQTTLRERAVTRSAQVLENRLKHLAEEMRDGRLVVDARHTGELGQVWQELGSVSNEQFSAKRLALVARRQAAARTSPAGRIADFSRDDFRDWYVTGDAFGTAPSPAGQPLLQVDRALPVKTLTGIGAAHSGLMSHRLRGALRSRSFPLDKKALWVHVAGKGSSFRLIVDGYQLVQGPLHAHFAVNVNHGDAFQWHRIDTAMGFGMQAYIEFLDEGDGWIAVDRIALSDGGPPEPPPNALITRLIDDPAAMSPDILAKKYQELLTEIVEQWRDGKLATQTDAGERAALLNDLLRLNSGTGPTDAELIRLNREVQRAEAALPSPRRALAMTDGNGINEYVHIRGNHKLKGPDAPRGLLEAIAGTVQPVTAVGSGRLELVERILAPSNPLLRRVIVNRLWHHHFGAGLVRSVDDFGVQGQLPTHPELLDWLAGELVRRDWSLKAMHRLMVLSKTYAMASRSDEKTEELDPQNKLLHRANIRRLEGEAIRDSLLSASGRLDRRMYGPSVLPHLTDFMIGRGRPGSGPLDGDGRRSLYENVRRNFLNPMFLAFDYPIPFTTIGRRSVSNVPAQALTMLNNPLVLQQARRWADNVLAEKGLAREQRVAAMYETAFGREPTATELADAIQFLTEQGREYGSPDDPRTWADFGHVLFNVKEFILVN